jgi:sarcosine oxidase subunit alpha
LADRRVQDHPVLGPLERCSEVSFTWQGQEFKARKGETIAAALMAGGVRTLRTSEVSGAPRGVYCAIGHCMECRVTVNGQSGVRACLTPIKGGEEVNS